MSYIVKRLAPGESILHEGRFHWLQKILPWLALIFLGILIIGVFIWIADLIRLKTTEMLITNRRVVLKRGFFNVKVDELNLASVEGAHIEQSFIGRIFGFGRLTLRGRGETEIVFPAMARPAQFRSALEAARMEDESRPVEVVAAANPVSPVNPSNRSARRELLSH
jgi:uncharacterized membrane protein YdbT with pleckstrin-like domain